MMRRLWDRNYSKSFNISRLILISFFFVAVFHKFIVNDIPVLAKGKTGIILPVIQDYSYDLGLSGRNPHIYNKEYKSIINPLILLSPYATDVSRIYAPPGQKGHLLGTDSVGRDVFAGLVYGTVTAFKVSIFGILLALFIGIAIGVLSGYYFNNPPEIEINFAIISILLGMIFFSYLIVELTSSDTSFLLITLLFVFLVGGLSLLGKLLPELSTKKIPIKIAQITDKLIEIREAIPSIFLVLGAIALFLENSIWNIVLIIGLISWSNIARYIRAEVLKIRSNHFIDAAVAQGMSTFRILRYHILPNAIDPIFAVVTFSLTTAILLEATLSFLGIGMPPQEPTWGAMLAQARDANAWWLAVFPGMCIFIIISCLNVVADHYQEKLDVRLK